MNQQKLENSVRRVLVREKERVDQFLTNHDIDVLLHKYGNGEARKSIVGYPTRPLYREITAMLLLWLKNRRCPVLDLPSFFILDEKVFIESRTVRQESAKQLLDGLDSFWGLWTTDEKDFRVREILVALGKRGMLDLVGVRQTVGTIDTWPPSRQTLLDTFEDFHTAGSKLTVGARALSKHCHRDESSSWWGVCTGSDAMKNEHALSLVNKVLDGATWINIHQIVHDVQLLETRQEQGYGARWTADGKSFRGFLEPQMVDGHDIGWKH